MNFALADLKVFFFFSHALFPPPPCTGASEFFFGLFACFFNLVFFFWCPGWA
jgi:hypothetical protein